MDMHSISWWPVFALVVTAAVVDIHSRRIPNRLVLPFLAGGVAVNTACHGAKAWDRAWEALRWRSPLPGYSAGFA